MIWLLTGYLLAVNLAGFLVMAADKNRAVSGAWRIPEKAFFLISIAGGSLGTLLGMYLFHHKTKHWYFVVFIPVILILQIILALIFITVI